MKNKWLIYILFLALASGIETASASSYPGRPAGESAENTIDTMALKEFDNDAFSVIFTFGQSNSANYGQTLYACQQEVYNWHNGTIYKAQDPLKGAGGNKGSVWTRLGDQLINKGICEKILLVPIGIGATKISQWAANGQHHPLLLKTIRDLKKNNIKIDLILWHQGESDNVHNTTSPSYITDFKTIRSAFRDNGINAPLFVAIATYHPNENSIKNKQMGCDTIIQNAQRKIIAQFPDVYPGPNTDLLDKCCDRHDGVHFSVTGLDKHAGLWRKAIEVWQDR